MYIYIHMYTYIFIYIYIHIHIYIYHTYNTYTRTYLHIHIYIYIYYPYVHINRLTALALLRFCCLSSSFLSRSALAFFSFSSCGVLYANVCVRACVCLCVCVRGRVWVRAEAVCAQVYEKTVERLSGWEKREKEMARDRASERASERTSGLS